MAKRYAVDDRVRLTRKVSVSHFAGAGMAITGKIAKVRDFGYRELSGLYGPRNYGIEFDDRPGVWWYAREEIRRIRGG